MFTSPPSISSSPTPFSVGRGVAALEPPLGVEALELRGVPALEPAFDPAFEPAREPARDPLLDILFLFFQV